MDQFQRVPAAAAAAAASLWSNWPGVLLCSSLSCLSCWYFILKYSKNHNVVCWPLIGSLPSILLNSHRLPEWIAQVFLSADNGVGTKLGESPIFLNLAYLSTCHPQNMEYILKTNFSNFPKGADFKEMFDILGDGILNVDGESWSFQRRMIHAIFTSAEFRSVIATTTRRLVESELVPLLAHVATQGSVIDWQDICKRFAFDSSMKMMFGREERYLSIDLPRNEFSEAMDDVHEAVLYRYIMPKFCWKLLRLLNVGKERKLAKATKTIDSMIAEYISLKRESLNKDEGNNNNNDLLSMSIMWSEESMKMKDEFLRDVMVNLFFAGKDTIASALGWFFWMVAKTPHVERKIVEELKSVVLKKNTGNGRSTSPWVFELEDVKELVYLHAALCEHLRLYSPIHISSRSVVKEDVLPDGTVVKPGMRILLSYYAQGKMPWIWGEDSLEFKPERWINNEGKLGKELLTKFFAFNAGPRSCLGKDMAFRQLKVFVSTVLFNFHVELVDGHQVCSKPAITLDMKDGLLVKIQKRVINI